MTCARVCCGVALLALAQPAQGGGDPPAGPAWIDVTIERGINHVTRPGPLFPGNNFTFQQMQRIMGHGVACGDYDNDGDLDLYIVSGAGFSNALLRNELMESGTPGFTDVTKQAGADSLDFGRMAHFADLDNDGWLDLLVINDDHFSGDYGRSRVFRNNTPDEHGVVTFTDVTEASGFRAMGRIRAGCALADADNDGDLDIYVTNWCAELGHGTGFFAGANRYFENLGAFVFNDTSESSGLGLIARDSFTPIFHDFDGDHRPDLYIAVDHTSDEFFRNTPDGFLRVTEQVGATHVGNDMGAACADFDDDGDLDLYTTNISDPTGNYGNGYGNALYLNEPFPNGLPSFTDVAAQRGAESTHWGWGVEFTDADQDGDLDLMTVNGFDDFLYPGSPLAMQPPVFLLNDGTGAFTPLPAPGTTTGADSRCLLAFDYDRDGDDDLLITSHNAPATLLENVCPDIGHWLRVQVRQSNGANVFGIGVTVRATITTPDAPVTKRREILSARSYLAGAPAEVHFGLGDVTTIDTLEIEWTDGTITRLSNVPADQLLTITQPVRACAADLDASGALDAGDVLAFLDLFGRVAPAADMAPPSGVLDFDDVLAFLVAYASGCP